MAQKQKKPPQRYLIARLGLATDVIALPEERHRHLRRAIINDHKVIAAAIRADANLGLFHRADYRHRHVRLQPADG